MVALNLPAQTTPFVGRTEELAQIAHLLAQPGCRLLTLVGPGGIGKTRLALEAARQLSDFPDSSFPDGVHFIALQSVAEPEFILSAVADALAFRFFQGVDVKGQIIDHLASKTLLLILDNVEHLLEGMGIISELLAALPGLKMLATSRETLNLQEEWTYPVKGMPFPNGRDDQNGDYSAIQLFVACARRARPDFSLEQERQGVMRICRLVEGMPLGLELAATWVRALPCDAIALEIERSLDFLETPARNVPLRHRNMRAVLDQSWKLLEEEEQLILRRLSVFRGGFTREAAEAVTGAQLRHLLTLVDKSWLRRDAAGRYDIHELLLQYAGERMVDSGEAIIARDTHSRYFANFMHDRERDIKYGRQLEALIAIDHDFANVRAAWQWASERRQHHVIERMTESLNFYCDMRARFIEGEELLRSAASCFPQNGSRDDRLTYRRLRARRARLNILGVHNIEEMETEQLNEMIAATAEMRTLEAPAELAFHLMVLGMTYEIVLYLSPSRDCFQESLEIYEELNDPFYMAEMLVWLGCVNEKLVDSRPYFERALALQRQTNDRNGMSWTLLHLSRVAFVEGRYAESDAHAQEAIDIQRERGDQKGLYWSTMMAALRLFRLGRFEESLKLVDEAAHISNKLSLSGIRPSVWALLGLLLIVTERDYDEGRRLCAEAVAFPTPPSYTVGSPQISAHSGLAMAAHRAGDLTELQRQYQRLMELNIGFDWYNQNDRFNLLCPIALLLLDATGRYEHAVELYALALNLPISIETPVMDWLELLPLVQRSRAKWETRLGTADYARAFARGKTLSLDATVMFLMAGLPDDAGSVPAGVTQPTQPLPNPLTERELEVLGLVAAGQSNREIARELVLALGTVKWYISEIFSKLDVTSRTQAVARARDLGLIA